MKKTKNNNENPSERFVSLNNIFSSSIAPEPTIEKSPIGDSFSPENPAIPLPKVPSAPKENDTALASAPDEVLQWLRGSLSEPPTEVSRMMDGLVEKMRWYMADLILRQVPRLNRLAARLHEVEQNLYSRELGEMSVDEMYVQRDQLTKTVTEHFEFFRKFVAHSKEMPSIGKESEIMSLLKSMSPAMLSKVRSAIESVVKGGSDVPE